MTEFERKAREHIASRGSPDTRALYTADLARWLKLCEVRGFDPSEPTVATATAFRETLENLGLADATIRRTLSTLSSMYSAAGMSNPFQRLPRPPADAIGVTKCYTSAESEALLAAARAEGGALGARDYAVMRIIYDTGMRVSSVTSLRREQVYDRGGGQNVIVQKVKKKGRVEIELPATSIEALSAWLDVAPESTHLFPSTKGGGAVTRRAINCRFRLYGEQCGIKKATPHRFRASYITEAIDAGIPLSEVQASVHHSDPKTTQRYDRGTRGRGVADAVAAFRSKK